MASFLLPLDDEGNAMSEILVEKVTLKYLFINYHLSAAFKIFNAVHGKLRLAPGQPKGLRCIILAIVPKGTKRGR